MYINRYNIAAINVRNHDLQKIPILDLQKIPILPELPIWTEAPDHHVTLRYWTWYKTHSRMVITIFMEFPHGCNVYIVIYIFINVVCHQQYAQVLMVIRSLINIFVLVAKYSYSAL